MSALSAIARLSGRPSQAVVTARSASTAFLGLLLSLDARPGDEVILPVSICQTMVNAVLLAGATPVLADCGEAFELSAEAASRRLSKRTRVVVFHHPFGRACDLAVVRAALADRNDLLLVEDCAQAPGAGVAGHVVGTQGDIALFSFGAGKPVDAGVGGALVADAGLIARIEPVLRVGRRGWPDDEQLGLDSTLTEDELGRLARVIDTYPPAISRRIAKVRAALGGAAEPEPGPPADVYHRLVLDIAPRHHARLKDLDPDLWQAPSPRTPPYATPFMRRHYEGMGRADLCDPEGKAFPVWRERAAQCVLVRTDENVSLARLSAFCCAVGARG